jgi:hypothetical protein
VDKHSQHMIAWIIVKAKSVVRLRLASAPRQHHPYDITRVPYLITGPNRACTVVGALLRLRADAFSNAESVSARGAWVDWVTARFMRHRRYTHETRLAEVGSFGVEARARRAKADKQTKTPPTEPTNKQTNRTDGRSANRFGFSHHRPSRPSLSTCCWTRWRRRSRKSSHSVHAAFAACVRTSSHAHMGALTSTRAQIVRRRRC